MYDKRWSRSVMSEIITQVLKSEANFHDFIYHFQNRNESLLFIYS